MDRKCAWIWFASVLSSLGAFLFGLDIGYIAPILECASFKRDVAHLKDWDDPESAISSSEVGFIVGVFSIGCIAVSFPPVSSYFLDEWGRRSSIILGTSVFICGTLVQLSANSIRQIAIGRLVAGCSIGLLSTVVALYQSELAPASMRGGLTSLYQLMITLGILVATLVDVPLVNMDKGWRLAIGFQLVPAFVLLVGMLFLPRSPRWLVQRHRAEEALGVLRSLRSSEEEAREELDEILADHAAAQAIGEPRWAELFSGRVAQLLAVGVTLQLLQQLVGMNAFMYFGPRLFRDLGVAENDFQVGIDVVNLVSTFPALYLVDRCGRRTLLVWGAAGMALACGAVGLVGRQLALAEDGEAGSFALRAAMASAVFFFVANFAYGWGPVTWVYCAEIFPLRHRGRCVGLTTMSNWVGNYLVAQFTPVLFEAVAFGSFFAFGACCLAALALALWLPETRGLPLEQIGALFDAKLGGGIPDPASETSALRDEDPAVPGAAPSREARDKKGPRYSAAGAATCGGGEPQAQSVGRPADSAEQVFC